MTSGDRHQRGRFAIRALVAEDEAVPGYALSASLPACTDLEVVASVSDAAEAIELSRTTLPDVAVIDLHMHGAAVHALRGIAEAAPETRMIALSAEADDETAAAMLRAGAVGYLSKGAPPEEIVEAIRRADRGLASIPASLLAALARGPQSPDLPVRRAAIAQLVSAGEEERRQVAAEIHDDSIQVMTAAGMRLQILRRSLDSAEQISRLDELEAIIQLSIARLRRLIFELRPPALDTEGLAAALRLYVETLVGEMEAAFVVDATLAEEPSEAARITVYRIAQEVLKNVRRHAKARRVEVSLADRDNGVHVRIVDDGVGFAPGEAGQAGGLGLAAIRERAELTAGWLSVESRPGEGTAVEFWIPADAGAGAV